MEWDESEKYLRSLLDITSCHEMALKCVNMFLEGDYTNKKLYGTEMFNILATKFPK
jgi:hypothetical protein